MSAATNPPGYFFPEATAIIPSGGSIAVNTGAVITFNLPIYLPSPCASITVSSNSLGTLTEGTHYTLTLGGGDTVVRITFIGPYSPIPDNDTVTINVVPNILAVFGGITDNPNGITVQAALSGNFTVGTAWDSTAPNTVAGTNYPTTPPVTVYLTETTRMAQATPQEIHVQFDEDIDPTSINTDTLYLTDAVSATVPATISYVAATRYAILTPTVNLDPSTTYTVHVREDIRDLSGNTLGPGTADFTTWSFVTTASLAELDITPGVAPTLSELFVNSVSTIDGSTSWITNEPTYFTINYGRNSTPGTPIGPSATATTFGEETLTPLSTNARYWFNIDFTDIEGLAGTNTGNYQFNTESSDGADYIDTVAGNQNSPKTIPYSPIGGGATGCYLFWNDSNIPTTYTHIYGQLFNSGFTAQWNGGARQGIFTEPGQTYTYQSAVEDCVDNVIVIAQRTSDSHIYAKRLDASGTILWSYSETDPGLDIRSAPTAAISSMHAVPVYTGTVQIIRTGTATMNIPGFPIYDFSANFLSATIQDGADYIVKPTGPNNGSTVIKSTNFRHVIGQSSNYVASGDTYYIADASTTTAITQSNHEIRDTNPDAQVQDYSSTSHVYTPHNYSPPLAGWLGVDDIVQDGSNFGIITAITTVSPLRAAVETGTAGGTSTDQLQRWFYHFWTAVSLNDIVVNDTPVPDLVSTVIAIHNPDLIGYSYLELDPAYPVNFNTGDAYLIYDWYCSYHKYNSTEFNQFYDYTINWAINIGNGTSFNVYDYLNLAGNAVDPPVHPLYDDSADFLAAAPIPVDNGHIVINYTDPTGPPADPNIAAVDTTTAPAFAVLTRALNLDTSIMTEGDNYEIMRIVYNNTGKANIISVGTTDGGSATHLVDSSKTFLATVQAGDVAYNVTSNTYGLITNVTNTDLTLSTAAAGFGTGMRYIIIRQRGILYTWQENGNVWGRILTDDTGTVAPPLPDEIRTPWAIVAGTSPRSIPDGNGNAILVYETAGSGIHAARLNGWGTITNTVDIDTNATSLPETIKEVKSDGNGGVIILYKYNNGALHAQRIAGTTWANQWGTSGYTIHDTTVVTDNEVIAYDSSSPNDIIVTATVISGGNYDIWARRMGTTSWGPFNYTSASTARQEKPQAFLTSTYCIIVWDDYRFFNQSYIDTGYGIFGLKISPTTGTAAAAPAPLWRANSGGTDDFSGVSVILNHFNEYPGVPLVVPYNSGTDAMLLWTDYRADLNADLKYTDLDAFVPTP